MSKISKVTIGIAGVILLIAFVLIIGREQFVPDAKFHGKVEDLLPKPGEIAGWEVAYAPIAATPEEKAKVDELLNYDQGVFVNYRRAGLRISVYLAYWQPGKMPIRAIASHTPDVCWVKAGWQCILREELTTLALPAEVVPYTEYRAYTINDRKEYVMFWHIGNGKIMSYRTGGRPPWYAIFTDVISRRLDQQPEQFFLRISSDQPREQFWDTEIVRVVMSRISVAKTSSQ